MPTKRVKGKKKLKSVKAKQTDAMGSKRRLAKLGKEQRKGMRGSAANYITRSQALKKLQISLKDFRRLCILKGIYPREPKKKPSGTDKTYYYLKDVMFLAHEPVLHHFRAFKTFLKKVTKAMGKKDYSTAMKKHENRPLYELNHIVKERYPRFVDALQDLDDALCLVHLFALMPTGNGVQADVTSTCLQLVREWQNYIVESHALTKVFVSIKGIYYQAIVHGQILTWLVPHQFTPTVDKRVDVRVMLTFLEFYQVLLKFVNAQLYLHLGIAYPPKINLQLDAAGAQLAALKLERTKDDTTLNDNLENETNALEKTISHQQKESEKRIKTVPQSLDETMLIDDDPDEFDHTIHALKEPLEAAFASNELATQVFPNSSKEPTPLHLFTNLTFFLSREVPSACLELVLRSHGATLAWNGVGSPYPEQSPRITHHVMDRPHQGHRYFNREYVQPQWIFDSVNNGMLLPLTRYVPGADLPPHLSPFVTDNQEGYTPEYRKELERLKSATQVLREVGVIEADDVSESEEDDAEEMYVTELQAERHGNDDRDSCDENEERNEVGTLKRNVEEAGFERVSNKKQKEDEANELKELAKTMMSKKAKRLYDRMQYGLGKKADKIQMLEDKRRKIAMEKATKKASKDGGSLRKVKRKKLTK
ncbi:hypothetical protein CCR75_005205 [Bremia lactucae]|uniref:Pescadillo homolog n=1 Tax=Bremia lactucae TaxID=4779 RepID=A0A976IM69_BRELC|nr:hypothetical protein CCR75_005205 [Bremia lactucae]